MPLIVPAKQGHICHIVLLKSVRISRPTHKSFFKIRKFLTRKTRFTFENDAEAPYF